MKRSYFLLLMAAGLLTGLQACKKASGDYPGDGYTWDMMRSRAYEPYALNPIMPDSVGAMLPVNGTIAYPGDAISGRPMDPVLAEISMPYAYAKTDEDYERAGVELVNPLPATPENIAAGQHAFNSMCAVCHGVEGNGKGVIVTSGKYGAVPPSYYDAGYIDMPDGKMFHSLTYGKNAMGSYAYALTKKERWQIILYINSMQDAWLAANQPAQTEANATDVNP